MPNFSIVWFTLLNEFYNQSGNQCVNGDSLSKRETQDHAGPHFPCRFRISTNSLQSLAGNNTNGQSRHGTPDSNRKSQHQKFYHTFIHSRNSPPLETLTAALQSVRLAFLKSADNRSVSPPAGGRTVKIWRTIQYANLPSSTLYYA